MRFKHKSLFDIFVQPKNLVEARKIVHEKYEKHISHSISDNKWPVIYRKIQTRSRLRLRDLKYALHKTDELNQEEQLFLIEHFNQNYNDPHIVSSCFYGIATLLKPWTSLKLIFNINIASAKNIKDFDFFTKNKNIIMSSKSFDEFAKQLLDNLKTVQDLNDFFNVSEVCKKVGLTFVQEDLLIELFQNDTFNFLEFLTNKMKINGFLSLIERYVGNYFLNHQNWSSLLLDKRMPLTILMEYIIVRKIPTSDFGERLRVLHEKYVLTTDFMKGLRDLSLERANYWENKIRQFDSIDIKKFGNQKIALAMYLKNYVVIEVAPVGNAAYFYTREVFDEQIKDSSNWSQKEYSGIDLGKGGLRRSEAFNELKRGSFTHTRGKWMRRMDDILKVLMHV